MSRPDLAPQGADQPAREAVAAKEEFGIVGAECLKAAIWADPFVLRPVRRRGLGSRDPAHQALKRPLIVERLEELDPRSVDEEFQDAPRRPAGAARRPGARRG